MLFADVRGYTSLSERLSPAEVTGLMNRFYQTASAALLPHGAILGQIAGDQVMGLFVPGLAGPDYPRKAVEAAHGLLRAVGYGTPEGNWLDVGAGISSGEEFVGNVGGGGYKDFTALGDVTNTAARFQALARGGEILLDAPTYLAVAPLYPRAERQELQLKGKQAPVEGFRIDVA